MKLGSTFTVPADPAKVFELFLDPDTMRSCIPGCEELVRVDETHYTGRLVNEIAHVRFNATFSAEIVSLDSPREVRAVLKGEDRRLGSSLKLDATLEVAPEGDDRSAVSYAFEMAMWGKLGRMGESIVRRRTAEVERQFVESFSRAASGLPLEPAAALPAARPPVEAPAAAPAAAGVPAQAPAAPVPAPRQETTGQVSGQVSLPAPAAGVAALLLVVLGWLLGRGAVAAGASR